MLVSICVGGVTFYCPRQKLEDAFPDTMLGAMFSARNAALSGAPTERLNFPDNDPRVFEIVLGYLYHGEDLNLAALLPHIPPPCSGSPLANEARLLEQQRLAAAKHQLWAKGIIGVYPSLTHSSGEIGEAGGGCLAASVLLAALPPLTEKRVYEELDFWGVFPSPPSSASLDLKQEWLEGIALVADAIRNSKGLNRLRIGFLEVCRFVSPTYTISPVEETSNLRSFLYALHLKEPKLSAATAFERALESWSKWNGMSEAYARSIIRGVERFLRPALAQASFESALCIDVKAAAISSGTSASPGNSASSSNGGGGRDVGTSSGTLSAAPPPSRPLFLSSFSSATASAAAVLATETNSGRGGGAPASMAEDLDGGGAATATFASAAAATASTSAMISSSTSSEAAGCSPLPVIFSGTSVSGPPNVADALQAARIAASVYSASALIAHSASAQAALRRELAREGLSLKFSSAFWPEDVSDAEPGVIINPYEDCPDLSYGSIINRLWANLLKGSTFTEPAVWRVSINSADKEKLLECGVKAKKGVSYLLVDVKTIG